MVLDARLAKLARGISAAKAAKALVKSFDPDEAPLSSLEKQQAREFEATLEAMFLMAAVDGEISKEEVDQLRASVEALIDMEGVEKLQIEDLFDELNGHLERDGWRARVEDVASRLPTEDARAFAFKLAAGVALVDDVVAHAEAAGIETLANALGLSHEESQEVLKEVYDELFGAE